MIVYSYGSKFRVIPDFIFGCVQQTGSRHAVGCAADKEGVALVQCANTCTGVVNRNFYSVVIARAVGISDIVAARADSFVFVACGDCTCRLVDFKCRIGIQRRNNRAVNRIAYHEISRVYNVENRVGLFAHDRSIVEMTGERNGCVVDLN